MLATPFETLRGTVGRAMRALNHSKARIARPTYTEQHLSE